LPKICGGLMMEGFGNIVPSGLAAWTAKRTARQKPARATLTTKKG
jgi:hypothetical protein